MQSKIQNTKQFEPISLEAKNLGKSYDDTTIIHHTNFKVEGGQSIALVSPSGSGKSTMLSMLGLLLTPSEGEVLVNGKAISCLNDIERSQIRLDTFGFIFQHTQLVGSLRAIENVCVPTNFAHIASGDAQERARELLSELGLEDRLFHYPYQLSIGQKRRVACARALMMNPPILIADEPTNDLDAESTQSVVDILFQHVDRGGILLFATHDLDIASKADRILHLNDKVFF